MDDNDIEVEKKADNDIEELDATGTDETDSYHSSKGADQQRDLKRSISHPSDKEERYDMNHEHRGLAIIVSNMHVVGLPNRVGTNRDAEGLKKQFSNLDFKVEVYVDLKAEEIEFLIRKAAKLDIHMQSDAFVFAILSHGKEGKVYGSDGKTVEADDIVAPFKGDVCKSLAGKPKLFFIQACRGTNLDSGVEVSDAVPDYDDTITIPVEADILLAFSVSPGYSSFRNEKNGAWFVEALCEILEKYGKLLDMLSMMTRVNRKMAFFFESKHEHDPNYAGKKQVANVCSTLTKELYFPTKSC